MPTVSPLCVACVVVATAKGLKGGGRGGGVEEKGGGEVWFELFCVAFVWS